MKNSNKESKELNTKQRLFVEAYLQTGNGTDSVRKAGYQVKSPGSAAVTASRLLANPLVKAEIDRRIEKEIITTDEILQGVREIALNLMEKASDRLRAFELLGKHKGTWGSQDLKITGDIPVRMILPGDDGGQ